MNLQLAEIRQTARRTSQAVLAKIHEPLRPIRKRKPAVEIHLDILKEALEQLAHLVPGHLPEPEPLPRKQPRIARPVRHVQRRMVVEPVREDDFFSMPRDPGQREQEIMGCKTLLLEIVRRAAYDWVLYRTSRRMLHRVMADQAYTWIFVECPNHQDWNERNAEGKHLTSFTSICEHLDLQPDVVRSYIRRLQPKNVMSVGRPAEYRKRDGAPAENAMLGVSDRLVDSTFAEMTEYEEDRMSRKSFMGPQGRSFGRG